MRHVGEDLPVLEGARLALVGIADDVLRRGALGADQRPLLRRRKTGAAQPAQAGLLEIGQELVGSGWPAGTQRGQRTVVLRLGRVGVELEAPRRGRGGWLRLAAQGSLHRLRGGGVVARAERRLVQRGSGRGIAATEAGDPPHGHAARRLGAGKSRPEPVGAAGGIGEMAGEIAAEQELGGRRRLAAEVRIERDQPLEPVERDPELLGELTERVVGEVPLGGLACHEGAEDGAAGVHAGNYMIGSRARTSTSTSTSTKAEGVG